MLPKEVGGKAVGRPHLVGAEREWLRGLVFFASLAHAYSRIPVQGRRDDGVHAARPLLPLEYHAFAGFVRASPPNDDNPVRLTCGYQFNAAHTIPSLGRLALRNPSGTWIGGRLPEECAKVAANRSSRCC